jgi:hypothetical protein
MEWDTNLPIKIKTLGERNNKKRISGPHCRPTGLASPSTAALPAMEPTCDAGGAGALSGGCHLFTGQGSNADVVRGRKIQTSNFCPALSAILQGTAFQACHVIPGSTAYPQLKTCVGARRAGPLQNQGWFFGNHFTLEGGHWCGSCKARTAWHKVHGEFMIKKERETCWKRR